jgi:hypothetical protein
MKARTIGILTAIFGAAAVAGGCANDGSNALSTASVAPDKAATTQMAAKIDPVCVSLSSQIDTLRKEGGVERLEKAATGKSANVQVKRASLAKQAELNKANADFQMKCGPQIPHAQSAQAAPAAAQVAPVATAAVGQPKATAQQAVTSAAQQAVTTAPKN